MIIFAKCIEIHLHGKAIWFQRMDVQNGWWRVSRLELWPFCALSPWPHLGTVPSPPQRGASAHDGRIVLVAYGCQGCPRAARIKGWSTFPFSSWHFLTSASSSPLPVKGKAQGDVIFICIYILQYTCLENYSSLFVRKPSRGSRVSCAGCPPPPPPALLPAQPSAVGDEQGPSPSQILPHKQGGQSAAISAQ